MMHGTWNWLIHMELPPDALFFEVDAGGCLIRPLLFKSDAGQHLER